MIALEEGRMVFYHEWYRCDILGLYGIKIIILQVSCRLKKIYSNDFIAISIYWISIFARKQKWRKFEYLTRKNNIISIFDNDS